MRSVRLEDYSMEELKEGAFEIGDGGRMLQIVDEAALAENDKKVGRMKTRFM